MSDERFSTGGKVGGIGWTAETIYLNSLADVNVPSPTDGLVLTYDAATGKWVATAAGAGADTKTDVYEAGVQVGTVARAINFDGTDFNVVEEAGPGYFTVTFAGTGMSAHDMTGAYHTENATGGVGNVIRATSATAFAWAQLGHGDLASVTSDQHHAQQHSLSGADHTGDLAYTQIDAIVDIAGVGANNLLSRADHVHTDADGSSKITYSNLSGIPSTFDPNAHDLTSAYHTDSGLTTGHFLKATGLTTFAWQVHGLGASDVGAYTTAEVDSAIDTDIATHAAIATAHQDAPGLISTHAAIGDAHHAESHDFDTHSGDVDLADLAAGSQGSIIKRGITDWEELVKGTLNYALVAGATDVAWAQYDYTWLANIPSTFAPSSHGSSAHTGNIFPSASQNLGTQYMDIGAIAAPTDPGVNVRRIFLDSGTGKVSVRTNASATISLEEQGGTDADAIHDNVAAEINAIGDKASPVGADVIVIEDSADSWNKKKVSITNLPGGADADAIHDNVSNEIQVITAKASPVGADVIIIEDSAATWQKKSVLISNLPAGSPSFGSPTGAIDIGDTQTDGVSTDSARADHQHAFAAPGAGYPLDVANTESDGTASTPARSDHVHAHGTITSANAHRWNDLAAMPDTTTTTIGKATPTAVVLGVGHNGTAAYCNTFYVADHAHTTTAGSGNQIDYTDLANIPSSFTPEAHVLGTSGPHSGTLPLTDLVVGSQGSIIYRDGTDWAELVKGTNTYVLKSGATDVAWGQVDYSELVGTQPAPVAHTLGTSGPHTDTLPLTDLVVGTQGSIIRRGAADWEEYVKGTLNYALVCTATDAVWAQYDYSWLANIPSTFAPSAHGSSAHSGAIFAGANDDFGAFYLDIDDIAVPADPVASVRRLFVDTATGKLSVRTNASTTISLEEQGGGVTWGAPTGNIDIGDAAVEGVSTDATRADHQHAFTAPGAGYPLDIAATESDGVATTPARSDHVHAHPIGLGADLHHPQAHSLSSTDHTGSLPLTDLDPAGAAQGSIIKFNADYELLAKGASGRYLKSGVTDISWEARKFTITACITSPAVGHKTVWRAPFACTCVEVQGRQKGGTSTVINARYNGTTDVATADLTLTAADTWYNTTGIAQTAWAVDSWLEVEVVTVGSATEITIQVEFTEP